MVEYVYALHDFNPEHEDEITFKAGDRIEIIEKDDLYGDGWWQGRTDSGIVGLFPQAYTSPTPPNPNPAVVPPDVGAPGSSHLDVLPEETDEAANTPADAVMAATMTDVQHAIDQLAVSRSADDSRRTFSFISGTDTDRETGDEADSEDLHAPDAWGNSRQLLARNAQKANMEAAAAQASIDRIAPPIPIEMSDESDVGEDDEHTYAPSPSAPATARAPVFAPEQINGQRAESSNNVNRSQTHSINTPSRGSSPRTQTGHLPEDLGAKPRSPLRSPIRLSQDEEHSEPASSGTSQHTPVSPNTAGGEVAAAASNAPAAALAVANGDVEQHSVKVPISRAESLSRRSVSSPVSIQPVPQPLTTAALQNLAPSQPVTPPPAGQSASLVAMQTQMTITPVHPTPMSVNFPVPPSAATTASFPVPSIQSRSQSMSQNTSLRGSIDTNKLNAHEWSVDQVVDWLRSKNFDETVCHKFIEHEISGDVLLELDVNMLKELDIPALGKRMKIVSAINDLKRAMMFSESPLTIPPSAYPNSNLASPIGGPGSAVYPGTALGNGVANAFLRQQSIGSLNHARNQSMSSNAPSGMSVEMSPAAINAIASASGDQSTATPSPLQSAPPTQVNYPDGVLNLVADKGRAESDPGALAGPNGMSALATLATSGFTGRGLGLPSATSVATGSSDESAANRKTSLRSKPPLVTLSPSESGTDGRPAVWASPAAVVSGQNAPSDEDAKGKGVDDGTEVEKALSDGEVHSGIKELKRRMSARKAVRASASSQVTAGSDGKSDDRASTPLSSIPPSPSLKGSTFAGTLVQRRKRSSDDPNAPKSRTSERLSFFGGTLGKGRKPPPSDISDTSPTVSSQTDKPSTHRSLSSRLYLGSQGRKAHVRPAPPVIDASAVDSAPASPQKPPTARSKSPEPGLLRKRVQSSPPSSRQRPPTPEIEMKPGMTALDQIGTPDHAGWMRKRGESFNAWKLRYFVLKGHHLYFVKSLTETKIKGYINIVGYKVVADENVHPGRYGFRIVHDTEKPHFFSSVEQHVVREWMKALMKATIGRDYSRPVVSSCNIPTIPLSIAQAMNPAPRPPSPTARDATQRALRRDNVNQLSSRDALVLMGMAGEPDSTDKARLEQFFSEQPNGAVNGTTNAPPRPSRELRQTPSMKETMSRGENTAADIELISWVNSNLPQDVPPATDFSASLSSGLALYRLAEAIKGLPTDVPDSAFPTSSTPDKLDGLFKLFDFMLDNDVNIGNVSINDVRYGNKEKITQLVTSLRAWQERRAGLVTDTIGQPVFAGPWMAIG
ncbi:polar growth protein [Tulasnella sp. 403]|nr:polar growth protein [Tulasnella sp. 403]